MYCHKCGKELDMGMEFCPFCGAKVTRRDVQVEVPIPTEEVAEEHTMKQEVVEETKQTLAKKRIEEMFTLCSREEEFLMLRQKILQMEVEEEEKATLLMALDDATRVRLDPIIELAEDYEEIRDFSGRECDRVYCPCGNWPCNQLFLFDEIAWNHLLHFSGTVNSGNNDG